jgi:hypothetical protein
MLNFDLIELDFSAQVLGVLEELGVLGMSNRNKGPGLEPAEKNEINGEGTGAQTDSLASRNGCILRSFASRWM